MISLMCRIYNKKKKKETSLVDTENRWFPGGSGVGKMGEGDYKVQTFSYKINKSWNIIYIREYR